MALHVPLREPAQPSEGGASEAADVKTKSGKVSTDPDIRLSSVEASAAAEGALPEERPHFSTESHMDHPLDGGKSLPI